MAVLSCLAVDDEPLALRYVSSHIEQTPFLRLAGGTSSALEALHLLQQQPIDLLFLDIHMPGLSGLELARLLAPSPDGQPTPRVVFTTAFNQYALDGYRLDALDYLLKPFGYEDFLRVALKAQSYFDRLRPTDSLPVPDPNEAIILKVEHQLVKIRLADILYIEGLRDYVRVHRRHEPKPVLSLSSLRALEERLPADRFMRVHRSFIVHLDCVDAVARQSVQIGTSHIPVSVQYKEKFGEYLKTWMS